ncbi:hypothetical protein [Saccharothrix coeruleofusca]|uniref:Excreted virulence factor EspC (Type VII ESX diderm) n=1 Tax=Saccharothrix coeruleofusca TaxID=33919 RepID=A0A918EDK3_9PSEU|nr:hypothetical protein [Saccharothrix coeruleofusca]MBP2339361.1 uncharacterized protein YukE [Saccharothrix coeruleofusca]GGP58241.1 hypothetical protein GCM10010185_33370 [Saccharothrix coeruleofusca]
MNQVGAGRIEVDPRWLELYARRVEESAEELSSARAELRRASVRPQSFGELGRALRSAEAYGRAAELLHQQLDRACQVLSAAASGLRDVAEHYGAQDEDAVALIERAGRR